MPPAMATAFVLILASDEQHGQRLNDLLRQKHGHSCRVETTLEGALESIRRRAPDVAVAVARAHGEETLPRLAALLDEVSPDATLIGVANGAPPPAPPARRVQFQGLLNPSDDADLVDPIGEAASRAVARRDDRMLKTSMERARRESFEGLVGGSRAIQRIIERIKKAARNKLTVLVMGETGVGKELIAKAIHRRSDRSGKPFKSLNCAGLSETLIESELFGHVKGSFTGAVADRKGYFAAADGGTLFLDEIGDMPLPMQGKLLRVLENREFTPVGSTEVQRVDVRVIAATNADLEARIEEKRFRADLYYRLRQWVIEVPPLRERREDVPLLAHHLLEQANAEHDLRVPGISNEAMSLLARHHWPGNVRELRNVVVAAVCEVEQRQIEADDLPQALRGSREIVPTSAGALVGLTMEQLERMAIERTLAATDGNREQAAKMLGIGTRTLYRKIKEYDIN